MHRPDASWLPNAITLSGVGLGTVAGAWMATGALFPGLALWWLGVLADNVDGPVARRLDAASPLGAQLDALGDLVLYAAAPALLVASTGSSGVVSAGGMVMGCAWRLAHDVHVDAKGVHFGALVVLYLALVPWTGTGWAAGFAVINLVWVVSAPALPSRLLRFVLALCGAAGLFGAISAWI